MRSTWSDSSKLPLVGLLLASTSIVCEAALSLRLVQHLFRYIVPVLSLRKHLLNLLNSSLGSGPFTFKAITNFRIQIRIGKRLLPPLDV